MLRSRIESEIVPWVERAQNALATVSFVGSRERARQVLGGAVAVLSASAVGYMVTAPKRLLISLLLYHPWLLLVATGALIGPVLWPLVVTLVRDTPSM